MGRVAAITVRLLRAAQRDRRTLALIVIAPVFILWLLTEALAGGKGVTVLLVDNDGSPFSRDVVRALDDLEDAEVLPAGDVDAAVASMLARDADAVLHIPRGAGETRSVDVIINNALQRSGAAVQGELLPALTAEGVRPVTRPAVYDDFQIEDHLVPPLTGALVFFLTYMLTGVSFLRERVEGTVERLFSTPLRRSEFVLGYFIAFGILATLQATSILLATIYLLDVQPRGSILLVLAALLMGAFVATGIGLLLSTFAENEFQVQQFAPIVIMPQIVLGGVLIPVSALPGWLQPASVVMPMTYLVDALRAVVILGAGIGDIVGPMLTLAGFTLLAVGLTVVGVRRAMAS